MKLDIFHEYEDWPAENTKLRVPRLGRAEALARVAGYQFIEERTTTGGLPDYTIREYRSQESGESRWLGGVFSEDFAGPDRFV